MIGGGRSYPGLKVASPRDTHSSAGGWPFSPVGSRRRHGQRKAKRGSPPVAALRPEMSMMQFNDRTADGQSHTHSVLLGGKKRFEDTIGIRSPMPLSCTSTRIRWIMQPGAQGQGSPAFGHRVHRVHAVDEQIDQNLLNLYPVSQDRRQPPPLNQVRSSTRRFSASLRMRRHTSLTTSLMSSGTFWKGPFLKRARTRCTTWVA